MKNLPYLVDAISDVVGGVALDIFGPKESDEWVAVQRVVESLPANARINYGGVLSHQEVEQALARAHFFVLPTLGENFGHAIYEALRIGRPVVISDRTPWRDLEQLGAGWDLPLESRGIWVDTLQKCIDMDDVDYRAMSGAAHAYAVKWFEETDPAAAQAAVFRRLLRS